MDALFEILAPNAVALYNQLAVRIYRSGIQNGLIEDDKLRTVAGNAGYFGDPESKVWILPLHRDGAIVGSIGLAGAGASRALLLAITDKIAIALARARAAEQAKEVEIERRWQDYRAAMMDALTHEGKNVLSSIKIAAANLLSEYPGDLDQQREMLALINQETDRMSNWLTETVRLSKANASDLSIKKSHTMREQSFWQRSPRCGQCFGDRQVRVETADILPMVECDPAMIRKVVELLLDNAAKYSPPVRRLLFPWTILKSPGGGESGRYGPRCRRGRAGSASSISTIGVGTKLPVFPVRDSVSPAPSTWSSRTQARFG